MRTWVLLIASTALASTCLAQVPTPQVQASVPVYVEERGAARVHPDYTSEGIYRITKDGKIGYVDSITSKVLIEPKFDCAFPFENGKAKVSFECKTISAHPGDEHTTWESDKWIYIDRTGKIIK